MAHMRGRMEVSSDEGENNTEHESTLIAVDSDKLDYIIQNMQELHKKLGKLHDNDNYFEFINPVRSSIFSPYFNPRSSTG
jgi:hypothetical protein